jgi:hypothetical protein
MRLRIHGDNILECEDAMGVILAALSKGRADRPRLLDGPLWAPSFVLMDQAEVCAEIQLFPGYGRWPYDIARELKRLGAPLREMVDAIVTEVEDEAGLQERPILAFEFCGALPAGNQSWQRCGRVLNAAYPRIPFFYFAELGGAELDSDRQYKAGRLPNPLIPFAYLALGDALSTLALPVFEPSPSIRPSQR